MTAIKLETRRSERGEGRTVITLGCDGPSCTVQVRSDEDEAMEAWWFLLGAESGDLHFHEAACHTAWATHGLRPMLDEVDRAVSNLKRIERQHAVLLDLAADWRDAAMSDAGSVDSEPEAKLLAAVDALRPRQPDVEWSVPNERGEPERALVVGREEGDGSIDTSGSDGWPEGPIADPPTEPSRDSWLEHLAGQHACDAHRAQHRARDDIEVWPDGVKHSHPGVQLLDGPMHVRVETAGTACPEDPDEAAEPSAARPIPPVLHR